MAFDLSTAKPVSGGFDISTAQAEEPPAQIEQPAEPEFRSGGRRRQRLAQTAARSEARREERANVFEGLPDKTINQILSDTQRRTRGGSADALFPVLKRAADFERLRIENPFLAQLIEDTGQLDALLIGAGEGVTTLARGVGLADQASEGDKELFKALQSQKILASLGQIVGETAPFLVPGGAIAKTASLVGRAALGAGLGAAEGGAITAGRGGTPEQILAGTALGAAFGGLPEVGAVAAKAISGRAAKEGAELTETVSVLRAQEAQAREITGEALTAESAEQGLKDIAEKIKTAGPEDIEILAQPDKAFYDAADELGITTEPLASFASQNPQFRAIESGLASIPASQLDVQTKQFITELGQKSDDLITEYGGTLDKGALSDKFRQDSLAAIEDLGVRTDELYDKIGSSIPPSTRVTADSTTAFIRQKAEELGGIEELSPLLKRTLKQLSSTTKTGKPGPVSLATGARAPGKVTVKNPTHERLNQTRREVGQAIHKGTGQFKDQESGLLKALYRRLRQDQDKAAEGAGIGDVSQSANALVVQRKQLEDNLTKLLGKDLEGSILPKVGQALKGLAKGDVQKWDSVMARIPNPVIRKEIVLTSLNDIFRGANVGGQSINPTQFTKFMQEIDRNPAIKNRLFKELPKESIRALENLKTVSAGISRALGDRITTGRISAFFSDDNGLLRRLMGKGISTAVSLKAGPLAGGAVNEFLKQATSGSKAAAVVLSSPQFQNMVRAAAKDGFTEGAEITANLALASRSFEKSRVFKKWADTLEQSEKTRLARIGVLPFLLGDDE